MEPLTQKPETLGLSSILVSPCDRDWVRKGQSLPGLAREIEGARALSSQL